MAFCRNARSLGGRFDAFGGDWLTVLLQAIKTGLDSAGFTPEVRDLASFQDDYGWKAGEDEVDGVEADEDEDEDDDDDDDDEDEHTDEPDEV